MWSFKKDIYKTENIVENGTPILLYYDSTCAYSACTVPTTVNYFLDIISFSAATAVFTDIYLTTKAPDGFYKYGTLNRQQSSGLLQTGVECSTLSPCTVPVVDCVVSEWSACIDGTETRSVITPASGGGTACPVTSRPCTVPVVDCVVSEWSACVNGIQTRSVITPASGGGTACPVTSQSCIGITPIPGFNYFSYTYDYRTGNCPEENYYVCDTATVARWLSVPKIVSRERYESGIQGYFMPYNEVINNANMRYEMYYIDPIPTTSITNRVYNVSAGLFSSTDDNILNPTDSTQYWNYSDLTKSYNNPKVVQFQVTTPDSVWFRSKTFNPPYTLYPTSEYYFNFQLYSSTNHRLKSTITITPTVANIPYTITLEFDQSFYQSEPVIGSVTTTSIVGAQTFTLFESAVGGTAFGKTNWYYSGIYKYYIKPAQTNTPYNFEFNATIVNEHINVVTGTASATQILSTTSNQIIPVDFINGFKPIGIMTPEESWSSGEEPVYDFNSITEQTYAVIVKAKNLITNDIGEVIVYGAGKNGTAYGQPIIISAPVHSIPEPGKSGGWLLSRWDYSNGPPTGDNTYPNHSLDYGPWVYVELQSLLTL